MRSFKQLFSLSFISRYRFGLIFYISVFWTGLDLLVLLTREEPTYYSFAAAIILRSILVFLMSMLMGYLLVFRMKHLFPRVSLWASFMLKGLILLVASYIVNYIIHTANMVFILDLGITEAFHRYGKDAFHIDWLTQKVLYWMALFILTQFIIEVNEKYAPGVFMDIFLGKYLEPKIEKRIVMFMDLKDSTPIAERLGHQLYFRFIRDFIALISFALIEHGGRIYQYVGDEVVVSWMANTRNAKRSMAALIEARKNLQKKSESFRRKYGVIPEFRVGIHVGDVTIGEVGVIKKDLVMSGDTMNTTARIRSACSELNQKFIVSKEMSELIDLKTWQVQNLGKVDLKGKASGLELLALKI